MCGFTGQYNLTLTDKNFFSEVLAIAKHRGPDQTGFWRNNTVQLGFNRLAIQDLSSAGHQPMQSGTQRYAIVFNGEIYNHLKLRKSLPSYNYNGHSDTETITHALDCWGIDETLSQLDGMFALAIFDNSTKELTLARDFAGIKPLFFGYVNGDFWFASQFNQVIKGLGANNLDINPHGMRDFMQLGYMQAPTTIYKNVYQVEPGQKVTFDGQNIKDHFYHQWNPIHNNIHHSSNGDFIDLFQSEVKNQLIADVPVATFFSSGIDSTLVTALAQKVNAQIKGFTIGVEDPTMNEAIKAKAYAEHLNLNHQVSYFNPNEALNIQGDLFTKLGEPFADYSAIPTYIICREGRKQATVMLSGDGGDELFWGYPRWSKFMKYYHVFDLPLFLRKLLIRTKRKLGSKMPQGPTYFKNIDGWVLNNQSHIFEDQLKLMLPNSALSQEILTLYNFEGKNIEEFRSWLRWNEFYAHMQRVLVKVDRMSMAHSLEVRVPFLGKRIIDFAWNQDTNFGIEHFENKKFLKGVLDNFIPQKLQEQRKLGFSIPLNQWIRGQLKEEFYDLLTNQKLYGQEYINREYWDKSVNDFFNNRSNSGWGLWILYSWQKWGEQIKKI